MNLAALKSTENNLLIEWMAIDYDLYDLYCILILGKNKI